MVGSPYKLYWVLSCVCYTLGLVATFISLFLMNSAQPVRIAGWYIYIVWLIDCLGYLNDYYFIINGLIISVISIDWLLLYALLIDWMSKALLYLVPMTLVPVTLVAWCRGELPAMWEGDLQVSYTHTDQLNPYSQRYLPKILISENYANSERALAWVKM